MGALLERLGVERPIVQAGMGGGVARHELAASVSEGGGLGTIAMLAPRRLAEEVRAARALTGGALAVNLLLPFASPGHWRAAEAADAVVTFWGRPQRRGAKVWIHQCGSVEEGRAAHAAGADAVIAQGVEAGGHVRGNLPVRELLERLRAALPAGFPLLAAGGIAGAGDVQASLEAGAEGAVLGTRFLLCEESRAHPAYKQAALAARETVLTRLFGLGWPAPHRVLRNAAVERWVRADGGAPAAALAAQRLLTPLARRLPEGRQRTLAAAQAPAVPLLSPFSPLDDAPLGRLREAGALYAGESVARIDRLRPAGELVAELTP